jgi:hypothetical protein
MIETRLYYSNGGEQYSFLFDYLDTDHIKVFVNGVSREFDLASPKVVSITNPVPEEGDLVLIKRETPMEPLIDFTAGSFLKETDLDILSQQLIYVMQELAEDGTGNFKQGGDGTYDAHNARIKNLSAPAENTDAVNKYYVDTNFLRLSGSWYDALNRQIKNVANPTVRKTPQQKLM